MQVWTKLGIKKEEVIQWVENCRKVRTLCTKNLQLESSKSGGAMKAASQGATLNLTCVRMLELASTGPFVS